MALLQLSCIAILIYGMYNACKNYLGNSPFILDFTKNIDVIHKKLAGNLFRIFLPSSLLIFNFLVFKGRF